uniref:O-methyltransferase domain-containing protein n=1 Tax=Picea sitchensis TaxID=3332 RepID=B8LPJ0_PICSI|nr:unknown [Picea sitchensis]
MAVLRLLSASTLSAPPAQCLPAMAVLRSLSPAPAQFSTRSVLARHGCALPAQCLPAKADSAFTSSILPSTPASAETHQVVHTSSDSLQFEVLELVFSLCKPMVFKAAVLLNIPDIIATHGGGRSLSVEEIASYIAASTKKPPQLEYLFRLLRCLASYHAFTESRDAGGDFKQYKYGLTNLSKLLVQKENDESYAPLLLAIASNEMYTGWEHLHESVIEGCSAFNRAFGMGPWEYMSRYPKTGDMFNKGMATETRAVMASVVKIYNDGFKNINTLVDVGGGTGAALSMIVKQHPHIRGINLDLPHAIAGAPTLPGVENVGGSMFEHIPPADAVFMKWILHDWNDEDCVRILKKCHESTPANGKVIVLDAIVEEEDAAEKASLRRMALMFDMAMMVFTDGGKERTEEEFKKLFVEAGFQRYSITKLPFPFLQVIIEVSKS